MNGTIQQQLKELFYSLGGNADDVRDLDDPGAIIEAISALNIGAKLSAAVELPELPEDDGTYSLQLVMDEGAATFSWETAADDGGK